MTFIELKAFTRQITKLLSDEEYAILQNYLFNYPDAGAVVKKTHGARKLRWRKQGRGKRGGLRIIYFHHAAMDELWMFSIYAKTDQEDLSESDRKIVKELIEEITR